MFKSSALIIAIGLIASFFSCSLDAMIARRPQGVPLSVKRRQAMLTNLKASGVKNILQEDKRILVEPYTEDYMEEDLVDIFSCKQGDIVVHQEGSRQGFCIPLSLALLSRVLSSMIDDIIGISKNLEEKIIIPLKFTTVVIKNTLDILKIYEKNQKAPEGTIKNLIKKGIMHYGIEPLIDTANCIHYLDCPQVIQSAFVDMIKIKHTGGVEAILANEDINPDLRTLVIMQQTVDSVTALLERKNIETKGKILQDYTTFVAEYLFVGINGDGTKIVEAKRNGFVIRNALNQVLMEQDVGFPVTAVAMSPDGISVVIGGTNGNLKIWDVNTKVEHNCVGHNGTISSIAFSSDGAKIASGSVDLVNNLIVWDRATGQSLNIAESLQPVLSVAFNFDRTKVVAGYLPHPDSFDNKIVVWDAETGSRLKNYLCQENYIYSVAFSSDDRKILYVGSKLPSVILELLNGVHRSPLRGALLDTGTGACQYLKKSFGAIRGVFSCDNRRIIIGAVHGIHIFDIDNDYNITQATYLKTGELGHCLTSMAMSTNGRKMVFGYGSKDQGDFPALLEYTFWTDQDEALINRLKNGTFADVLLVWKLCSQLKEEGAADQLSEKDIPVFSRFPKYMQQLLSDLFWPKGPKYKR